MRVLIVGGVAGGASTAARLRRMDEDVEIVIYEKGNYVSFANCGLPYYVSSVIKEREALELMTPEEFLDRFNFDVKIKHEVISINSAENYVEVKDLEKNTITQEKYDKLVLSPGAKPWVPPIEGINEVPYFTVRTIPDAVGIKEYIEKNKVDDAIVIGGGFIGLEMAENLQESGITTRIIEIAPQVMMPLDYEMAQFVHQELAFHGITLNLKTSIQSVKKDGDKIKVTLDNGKKITTQLIIIAVGIRADTSFVEGAGIELNNRGYFKVNNKMQTSIDNIFAVGDAVEIESAFDNSKTMIPLAGLANRQGRAVADIISGKDVTVPPALGTSVLKVFSQTVSTTGLNERQLKAKGATYEKIYAHPNNHAGYYPGAVELALKMLFNPENGKILGAQVVGGSGAEKRIDVLATAMKFNGTVYDLENLELAYAPPFGSAKDPVNMLGFIASNILRGDARIFHFDELDKVKENNGFLLDVRTKEEYDIGHIKGAHNISDLELRDRLGEIPKDRPIYINCQVGFRGYLAYRTLSQLGYDVFNLSGGYKTWQFANLTEEDYEPTKVDPRIKILESQVGRPVDDKGAQKKIKVVDACGLSCPGPLNSLITALEDVPAEQFIQIRATDPSFAATVKAFTSLNDFVDLIKLEKQGSELLVTLFKTKELTKEDKEEEAKIVPKQEIKKPVRPTGIPPVSEISAQELFNEINSDNPPAIIVDCRTLGERNHGYIKDSILIPLGDLMRDQSKLKGYEQKEIVIYCHTGSRSFMAARILNQNGFEYLRSLKMGIMGWSQAGFPYE